MSLDTIQEYVLANLVDGDTSAILLIGAWAKDEGFDPFDIDMMIIKKNQLTELYNTTVEEKEFHLDIWVYDEVSLKESLIYKPTDLNSINGISLSVQALIDAKVWYDATGNTDELIMLARNWTWRGVSPSVLDFTIERESLSGWLLNAVNEDFTYLKAAKKRLYEGTPVTHRKKDYPEIRHESNEEYARKLLELTETAYQALSLDYKWSEMRDAKRAMATGKYNVVVDSLKDILRYMLRLDLRSSPQQLMDPSIWTSIKDQKISDSLLKALKYAYI